jgi:hypothetical protein
VDTSSTCSGVHRLDSGLVQVTVLNFSSHQISDQVVSEHLHPGAMAIDMFSKKGSARLISGAPFRSA